MSHAPKISEHEPHQATYGRYVFGFASSIALTLAAYMLVVQHAFTAQTIMLAVGALAIVQLIVQLVFFLHVGEELRPRWKLLALIFMIVIVLIVVLGSLWIMANLDANMMHSTSEVNEYLHDTDGF